MFRPSLLLLLLGSTIASFSLSPSHAAVVTIPVTQGNHQASGSDRRLGVVLPSQSVSNKRAKKIGSVTVHNEDLIYFYGDVTVGTPPQKLPVLFEALSTDFWVINKPLNKHHYYQSKLSSTYVANGTHYAIENGRGSVSGFVSRDTLTIGGVTLPNQLFGEVNDVSGMPPGFADVKNDGYFGLGYDFASSTNKIVSPFQRMVESGALDAPMYSLYLGKTATGDLTLGGVDARRYTGNITYMPLVDKSYWTIKLDSVVSGKTTVPGGHAVVDMGTSFIMGPSNHVEALAKAVGMIPYPDAPGVWTMSCAGSAPDITFQFGGKPFTLKKSDYANDIGGGECQFAFSAGGDDPTWLIGAAFMRTFYTVFDHGNGGRVGFATLK